MGRRQGRHRMGPQGPELAVALPYGSSLLSEGQAAAPAADHQKHLKSPAFYGVFCCSHFSHFSELMAQDGSTWANIGFKMDHHSLKTGHHNPQDGPT